MPLLLALEACCAFPRLPPLPLPLLRLVLRFAPPDLDLLVERDRVELDLVELLERLRDLALVEPFDLPLLEPALDLLFEPLVDELREPLLGPCF
jgi:hypothetical protein